MSYICSGFRQRSKSAVIERNRLVIHIINPKTSIMKKFFMIAIMALSTLTMSAQEGKMAVGVNLGIAPSLATDYSPIIFGAKFQYEFVENIRGEVAANMFTKKNGYGLWDAELNFHYLFPVADGIKVYPAAGLVFLGTTGDGEKESGIGFNVGAGAEYYVAENIKINADLKYLSVNKKKDGWKVIDCNGITIALGVAYCF